MASSPKGRKIRRFYHQLNYQITQQKNKG